MSTALSTIFATMDPAYSSEGNPRGLLTRGEAEGIVAIAVGAPGPFGIVDVTPMDGGFVVEWSPSARAARYQVTVDGNPVGSELPDTALSAEFSGYTNGRSYAVTVQAKNTSFVVTETEPVTVTPQSADTSLTWVLSGDGLTEKDGGAAISVSRASISWFRDAAGTCHAIPANCPLRAAGQMNFIRNFFASPSAPATQSITLRPGRYLVSIEGAGSIAMSGAGASGSATQAAPAAFYTTGGSVTFTVSGTVTWAQVEVKRSGTTPSEKITGWQYRSIQGKQSGLDVWPAGKAPASASRGSGGTVQNLTVSASTVPGPDGKYWPKFTESTDASAQTHEYKWAIETAQTAGPKTLTVRVSKTKSLRNIRLYLAPFKTGIGYGAALSGSFDPALGTWGNAASFSGAAGVLCTAPGGSHPGRTAIDCGDYWEISFTAVIPAGVDCHYAFDLTSVNTTTYQGDGTGWLYVDCMQVDDALVTSPYADPADGTRAADVPSASIAAIGVTDTASIFVNATNPANALKRNYAALNDGSSELYLATDDTLTAKTGALTFAVAAGVLEPGWHKVMAVLRAGGHLGSIDGSSASNASAEQPAAATTLYIGCDAAGGSQIGGTVYEVQIDRFARTVQEIVERTGGAVTPPTRIKKTDSRLFSAVDTSAPFSAQPDDFYAQIHTGQIKINTITEPGVLAKTPAMSDIPGTYTLQRMQDPDGRYFYRCQVDSAWRTWGGGTTSRSEIFSNYNFARTVRRGQAYVLVCAYRPDANVFDHGGNDLDIFNFHQDIYTDPADASDTTSFPPVRGYFDSAHGFRFIVAWEPNQPSLLANITGGLNGAGMTTPFRDTSGPAGEWHFVVIEFLLHYLASANPYIRFYRSIGSGPLTLLGARTGPNCFNDVAVTMAQKLGCYKWDQTWGTKSRRTLDVLPWWIWKAQAGVAGEPSLTKEAALDFLRTTAGF